jgi:antitoxin PrlF
LGATRYQGCLVNSFVIPRKVEIMTQATITSKGRITIPASVRKELNVSSGDRLEFINLGNGRFEIVAVTREVTSLRGIFKSDKVVSIEEMNNVVEKAVK